MKLRIISNKLINLSIFSKQKHLTWKKWFKAGDCTGTWTNVKWMLDSATWLQVSCALAEAGV